MKPWLIIVTCLLIGLYSTARAKDAEQIGQTRPLNLSLWGPASTSLTDYSTTDHNLCIDLIHCGSRNIIGANLSYGVTVTDGNLNGPILGSPSLNTNWDSLSVLGLTC